MDETLTPTTCDHDLLQVTLTETGECFFAQVSESTIFTLKNNSQEFITTQTTGKRTFGPTRVRVLVNLLKNEDKNPGTVTSWKEICDLLATQPEGGRSKGNEQANFSTAANCISNINTALRNQFRLTNGIARKADTADGEEGFELINLSVKSIPCLPTEGRAPGSEKELPAEASETPQSVPSGETKTKEAPHSFPGEPGRSDQGMANPQHNRSSPQAFTLVAALLVVVVGGIIVYSLPDGFFGASPELPHASETKLSIIVAGFENDPDRQVERLICETLLEEPGIEVLRLEDRFETFNQNPQAAKDEAEAAVRAILRKNGSDIMVWGKVLRLGNQIHIKLHWTPSEELRQVPSWSRFKITESLALPNLLWEDLAQVLKMLLVAHYDKEYLGQEGRFLRADIKPFVDKGVHLLANQELLKNWTARELGTVQFVVACALIIHGELAGDNDYLEQAKLLLETASGHLPPQSFPLEWFEARRNLARVLRVAGERNADKTYLEESIKLYSEIVDAGRQDRQDALARIGLAISQYRLGERYLQPQYFQEAITTYESALEFVSEDKTPDLWGLIQSGLGAVYTLMGERTTDPAYLEKGIEHSEKALSVFSPERAPYYWGSTASNLGACYTRMAERNQSAGLLNKAKELFRELFSSFAQEQAPYHWAVAQSNFGIVLMHLGTMNKDLVTLKEAEEVFRSAIQSYTWEQAPLDLAMIHNNLGEVLIKQAQIQKDPEIIAEAIYAYERAKAAYGNQKKPVHFAITNLNAAVAYRELYVLNGDPTLPCQSVDYLLVAHGTFLKYVPQYAGVACDELINNLELVKGNQESIAPCESIKVAAELTGIDCY